MWKAATGQIPNALSAVRLVLGLTFPFVPVANRFLVIAVALFTEWADGAIARSFGMETKLGKILDPIADKVFVGMVLLAIVWDGTLSWWEALLVVGRDLVVVGAALWYWLSGASSSISAMAPSWPGKVATTLQFALLLSLGAGWRLGPLVDVTALVSIYAGMDYIVRFEWPSRPA